MKEIFVRANNDLSSFAIAAIAHPLDLWAKTWASVAVLGVL
ncbi:hypothetical protein [Trichocoleus sp. FACHB-591]|nr:hypothetical protein [Trichocoleus sp. FACHB-591]